jgi:hypothetical protein
MELGLETLTSSDTNTLKLSLYSNWFSGVYRVIDYISLCRTGSIDDSAMSCSWSERVQSAIWLLRILSCLADSLSNTDEGNRCSRNIIER